MDQVKVGKFIAYLCRREGLMQEELGQKIGVTNKTISRWENGNYIPDIEMLGILAELFHVSVDDLLSGKCRDNRQTDRKISYEKKKSAFSPDEQFVYWKRKWLREYIFFVVFSLVMFIALCVFVYVKKHIVLIALTPVIGFIIYTIIRNKMMIYVEKKMYDDKKR